MKRWVWRYVYALRRDNNTRMKTLWVFTGLLLVFNLGVLGSGSVSWPVHSDEAQRYYNAYFQGKFMTDQELLSTYEVVTGSIGLFFGWMFGWIRWFMWRLWLVLFVATVVYTPLAYRAELTKLKLRISRSFREQRGAEATGGPRVPLSGGVKAGNEGGLTFWQYMKGEIIWDILRDFVFKRR